MKEIKTGSVYKITSPTGRLYIGSTNNVTRRKTLYKSTLAITQTKLHLSLKKYGWENHIFEVIWEGPLENMLEQETLLGRHFDVLSSRNLNCKLPKLGEGIKVVGEETRKKMSVWQVGRKMSEEAKQKMSIAKKGIPCSTKQRETLLKFVKKIPVIQMDTKGNFIKEWESAKDAASGLLFYGPQHISNCCSGTRKSAYGFKWKFKN